MFHSNSYYFFSLTYFVLTFGGLILLMFQFGKMIFAFWFGLLEAMKTWIIVETFHTCYATCDSSSDCTVEYNSVDHQRSRYYTFLLVGTTQQMPVSAC